MTLGPVCHLRPTPAHVLRDAFVGSIWKSTSAQHAVVLEILQHELRWQCTWQCMQAQPCHVGCTAHGSLSGCPHHCQEACHVAIGLQCSCLLAHFNMLLPGCSPWLDLPAVLFLVYAAAVTLMMCVCVCESRPSGFQWPRLPAWKPPDEEDQPRSVPQATSGLTSAPDCFHSLAPLGQTAWHCCNQRSDFEWQTLKNTATTSSSACQCR